MRARFATVLTPLVALTLGPALVTGCSSATQKKVDNAIDSAKHDLEQRRDEVEARAGVELIRARLTAAHLADDTDLRSSKELDKAVKSVKDLPGNLTITGVGDASGDAKNDADHIQVTAGKQSACLTLPKTPDAGITTSGGACPKPATSSTA